MVRARRNRPRTRRLLIASFLSLLMIAMSAGTAAVSETPASAARRLLQLTNEARIDRGISPLQWNDALAAAAAEHAAWMVRHGQLSHQYSGEAGLAARIALAGGHFQAVAENIAIGPSAASLQRQWMNSPAHRANVLDPELNSVGFAVLNSRGELYAVADFERSVLVLTYDQIEAAVDRLVVAQGIAVTASRLDARQTCEMSHGSAGGSSPRFVMRWQSAELNRLPARLEEELHSDRYRSAAVGACESANAESGFTTYRVAVLLY